MRVAQFRGSVRCRRTAGGPLGLELSGHTAPTDGAELTLAFTGEAPPDLPEALPDALVEQSAGGEFRVTSGARAWVIAARSVHAHRDVRAAFYRAIPPRPAPLLRRLLLRSALTIASSALGLKLVRWLRR
jgi:hypothetical protein